MKFAFVTCVQLGLACMQEIYRVGGQLDLVITLPDNLSRDKSGRVYVDEFCAEHQVDVLKVSSINESAAVEAIRERSIDWLFIIGWSQIAKPAILAAPNRGALGIHPTLLPEGRGRAAIPWAILKGLSRTGVTLFKLDEGVDTGPVLAQEQLDIAPTETATSLYERVCLAHRTLIARVWNKLVSDEIVLTPQDHAHATVWPGRTPADGEIRPSMTVAEVERLVRATTRPYPGAFWKDGRTVRIWKGKAAVAATPPMPGVLQIELTDGIYEALEYDIEE
jgi:methionyl-tRNA formyltransferase